LLDLFNGPGSSVDSEAAILFRVLRQTRVASVMVPSGDCFAILSDGSPVVICSFLRRDSLLSNAASRPPPLTVVAWSSTWRYCCRGTDYGSHRGQSSCLQVGYGG